MSSNKDLRVKRMPVHEQVFNNLKDAINEGRWQVDEKIPTEMELSEIFGVNRLTVRMALQRLIGMGILESRVGDGTYVKDFSFRDYIEKASEFYLDADLLDKVCEFRNAIEVNALKLALHRAEEDELEELSAVCDRMDTAKATYIKNRTSLALKQFLDSDIEFHEKICQLSHNDLFVYSFDIARNLLYQYMESLVRDRTGSWIENAKKEKPEDDRHRLVYQALKERNIEKCMKIYSDIIDYHVEY
ncbi:MAG: GntR family transcriptional regulator [Eubacteriales bacterium]|nr:GntR family transcriptional regulator [Eubacteriales bacterium]